MGLSCVPRPAVPSTAPGWALPISSGLKLHTRGQASHLDSSRTIYELYSESLPYGLPNKFSLKITPYWLTVICGIKMVSETILWKWVLSPVIVFPERWADNSPQDIPLACVTLPQGKQNRPHFFFKMGLIFRADRTLLTGTEDQNVCPTGMKNNSDTDANSPYTKLVVPTKHIPGHQPGGPFQVPRSCCQDFPQLALTLSELWIN